MFLSPRQLRLPIRARRLITENALVSFVGIIYAVMFTSRKFQSANLQNLVTF